MKTTVLYHDDADGFGAAFALWTKFGEGATYIPVQYSQPVPDIPVGTKALYIVDFSYKREICEALAKKYELHIYDHHISAEKELAGLPYATFDKTKSGCALAWKAVCSKRLPELLRYVQDYDLWKFELRHSKELNLFVSTIPRNFNSWLAISGTGLSFADVFAGGRIRVYQENQVNQALEDVRMMRFKDGPKVPVVNCSTNISEIGHAMCEAYSDAPYSASYCDRKDIRAWSLRSIGDFDVSKVARAYGGGGHKNAAGFTTELGWPEYDSDEFIKAFEEATEE